MTGLWWSGFPLSGRDDFRAGGGDLAQGGVDVIGFDAGRRSAGGGDPCGAGEEVESAGVALAGFGEQIDGGAGEDFAIESGAGEVPVEVGGDFLAGQRGHALRRR
jgi:hypothetical protein